MEVIICRNEYEAAELVADAIEDLLTRKPTAVLGLATGTTPALTYDELERRCAKGRLSFSRASAFMLDEYLGLHENHAERYSNVIKTLLTAKVDIPDGSVHSPDSMTRDVIGECAAYERKIREAGGVDLQLLGIGTTGHIGFNEPTSSLASRTRIKTLTDQSRQDNSLFFTNWWRSSEPDPQAVPLHVITQGIGTILDARHVILMANGKTKASAIAAMVEGPLTSMVPASALQMHPHATVVVDEEAAGELRYAPYFRTIHDFKPIEFQEPIA